MSIRIGRVHRGSLGEKLLLALRMNGPMTAATLGIILSRDATSVASRLTGMSDRGLVEVVDKAGRAYVWAAVINDDEWALALEGDA